MEKENKGEGEHWRRKSLTIPSKSISTSNVRMEKRVVIE